MFDSFRNSVNLNFDLRFEKCSSRTDQMNSNVFSHHLKQTPHWKDCSINATSDLFYRHCKRTFLREYLYRNLNPVRIMFTASLVGTTDKYSDVKNIIDSLPLDDAHCASSNRNGAVKQFNLDRNSIFH